MRKLGFAKFGVTALSVLVATLMVRGLAHADTDPGSTVETKSTSQVQVTNDSGSTIQVENDQQSSQSVDTSTTDQTNTVSDVKTSSAPVSPTGESATTAPASTADSAVSSPTTLTSSANTPTNYTDGNGRVVNLAIPATQNPQTPIALNHSANQPTPIAPVQDNNKSLPAPTGPTGSVAPAASGSGGGFGRGMALRLAALRNVLPSQGSIAWLAVLLLITSSFMTYLRRSGFQHAPRSDASGSSLLSFATPRVEIQAGPKGAAPVFIVASDTKQLIGKEGRWM